MIFKKKSTCTLHKHMVRMCIGRKVAELEMFTLLAAIITRFQVDITIVVKQQQQQQEFDRLVGVVASLVSGPTHSSFPTETSSSLSPNGNSLPIQEHNPIFCNGKFHDREKL